MRRCEDCGAEYGDHAEFCNACGGERLTPLPPAPPPRPRPLRSDPAALVTAGLTWLIGLGYVLGALHPRGPLQLAEAWLGLTFFSAALAALYSSVRPFLLFSGVGLIAVLLYAVVMFLALLRSRCGTGQPCFGVSNDDSHKLIH